jgi:hypothetical protein
MKYFPALSAFCLLILGTLFPPASFAGGDPSIVWDGSEMPQGVTFYWYEPSFYVGFAPKTQDPTRPHIRLSRGNQLRITLVLGDQELDNYAEDLQLRLNTYQELIDKKVIRLSVNMAYERFTAAMSNNGVSELVASRDSLSPTEYRQKTVALMSSLNPGAVFNIHMDFTKLLSAWQKQLLTIDEKGLSDTVTLLDTANALLPGRINLSVLTEEQKNLLTNLIAIAQNITAANSPEFSNKADLFLTNVSHGHYSVTNDSVDAVEFTRIIPVGTLQATVKYKQWRLSSFGVTGIWHLIPRKIGRGQLGNVDYLSPNPGYGYIPLLQYQHATGKYYNAYHNAGVRTNLHEARFVPEEWKHIPGERNPKKSYQNLWIASRGPASHGCTRLPSGYMTEMRHMLPSSSTLLEKIATHRNLPQCYDLFDIDGNGTPEVMGVQYYLAFAGKGHVPTNAYAQNNRKDFYAWMYADNMSYNQDDSAVIKETLTCRFVGKKAKEAQTYQNQPLYEAEYQPEAIQFYRLLATDFKSDRGFTFNHELRRIAVDADTDPAKLFLQ